MIKNQTNGRKIQLKNLIFRVVLLVSLVMIMISLSYSWFLMRRTAEADGLSIQVSDLSNLEISSDGSEWVAELELPVDESFKFVQLSGNGTSFYSPVLELVDKESLSEEYKYRDYVISGFEPASTDVIENGVFTYDFAARIDSDSELLLSEAYVGSVGAGAIRGALMVKEGDAYRTLVIWIPDVVSKVDINGEITTEQETEVVFRDDNGDTYQIAIDGENGTYTDSESGIQYVWGSIIEPLALTDLPAGSPLALRLVLWIDGEDRDCRDFVPLTDVSVALHLSAGQKAAE